tara:strand:- start:2573 stop:2818 length:246 start_codon:yes stop_codon:yes gene_type:complete
MSDNVLLISKTLSFPKLMSIAEGMSYKHDLFHIKARGKQVQRAIEVAAMIQSRGRGNVESTEIGFETHDVQVPTVHLTIKV